MRKRSSAQRSDRESYVYLLFTPNGRPLYVGKGLGKRLSSHQRSSHNKYVARVIAKAGGEIPGVVLCEGLTESEAFACEVAWIAAIGRSCNGGPLANGTDGGDGVKGHRRTPEQRVALSVVVSMLWIFATRATSVTVTSIVEIAYPLFAVIFAALFLGEAGLTSRQMVGGTVILIGAVIVITGGNQ